MGLRIGTNVASISAQRNLQRASDALGRNFEHLSTGRRISRAADDAAGLSIGARLNATTRSIDQAVRNANDGVSLVQTAEGALAEIESALTRMRELSVQSGNGTNSSSDRNNLQAEFAQLLTSVDQIANSTSFNTISLLNSSSAITLQIGPGTTAGIDTLSVSLTSATTATLSISTLNIGSAGDPSAAIVALDSALNTVTTARGSFGAVQNRLNAAMSQLQVRGENLTAAYSRIMDVDVASETAALTRNSILQQAAISILAQANTQPSQALSLLG